VSVSPADSETPGQFKRLTSLPVSPSLLHLPGTEGSRRLSFSSDHSQKHHEHMHLSLSDKRVNAEKALARDRQEAEKALRCPQMAKVRADREVDDRVWRNIFDPIPLPKSQDPLASQVQVPSPVLKPRRVFAGKGVEFRETEVLEVKRVCRVFADLLRPRVPPGEEPGLPVLTRPVLCRLLLALQLRNAEGEVIYHEALKYFDVLATPMPMRGCPMSSGSTPGLLLDDHGGRNSAPIKLFEYVLSDIVFSHPCDGQEAVIDHLRMDFQVQLYRAEKQAKHRMHHLQRQLARGKAACTEADSTGTLLKGWIEKEDSPRSSADGAETADLMLRQEDALYAHTFAVSKGELLLSTLLEPEVIHLVWMYQGVFSALFDAYHDVRTRFLGLSVAAGGHMSRAAFMRFCMDFGLFPGVVDYNTLQCVYQCAESAVRLTPDVIRRQMRADLANCRFKVGDVAELAPGAASVREVGVRHGEATQIIDMDLVSETQACRVLTHTRRKVWVKLDDLVHSHRPFVPWVSQLTDCVGAKPGRLAWINLSFAEMTEEQVVSLALLSDLEDWMSDRRMRSRDVFSFINGTQDGHVGIEELMEGLEAMALQCPPLREHANAMLGLVDADGSGAVEYAELDAVLMAVRERKARVLKHENIFLKESVEMTSEERAAQLFFVPLRHALAGRRWCMADFLREYGNKESSGRLTPSELLAAGSSLGIRLPEPGPFMGYLVNMSQRFDGAMGLKELSLALMQVQEAIRKREKGSQDGQNPFLTLAPSSQDEGLVRVFGLKAFIECVLKIGIAYLSFHGSAVQSELPNHSKVMWLMSYMKWQLEQHKNPPTAPLPAGAESEARLRWAEAARECGLRLSCGTGRTSAHLSPLRNKPGSRRARRDAAKQAKEKEFLKEASQTKDLYQNVLNDGVHPADMPPLQRIMRERPHLFTEEPLTSPVLRGKDLARTGQCSICGRDESKGWGLASCFNCGLGDVALRACLADGRPEELPVLDRVVHALDLHDVTPTASGDGPPDGRSSLRGSRRRAQGAGSRRPSGANDD